jgi:hypothetical protein
MLVGGKDTKMAMTTAKLALIAAATAAATIGLAGTAHADAEIGFRSPSGDVVCVMSGGQDGKGSVACQVHNHTYPQPPLPGCSLAGREYDLVQGAPAALGCQGGMIADPPPPTLEYGQKRSVGTITCDVEPSGVTCTDSSSGHFMRLSRDSYQLG